MELARQHSQHQRLPVPRADLARDKLGRRKMHVLPLIREQPLRANGRYEASRGPMIQELGRLRIRQAQVHLHGMALIRANPQAVGTEREALLVTPHYDLVQQPGVEGVAMRVGSRDQCIDRSPSLRIEGQPDRTRSVPQHEAQEFAGFAQAIALLGGRANHWTKDLRGSQSHHAAGIHAIDPRPEEMP